MESRHAHLSRRVSDKDPENLIAHGQGQLLQLQQLPHSLGELSCLRVIRSAQPRAGTALWLPFCGVSEHSFVILRKGRRFMFLVRLFKHKATGYTGLAVLHDLRPGQPFCSDSVSHSRLYTL